MKILAIDPGAEKSAAVYLVDGLVGCELEIIANEDLRWNLVRSVTKDWILVIEQVEHYGRGMPVGKTIFDTVFWSGRFVEAWGGEWELIPRRKVKLHLCGSARAKDSNIRQALIDRFGPGKEKAVGTKKKPGPLYGIKKDLWSALALAVTYADITKGD